MGYYFENLKTYEYNDYLSRQPRKVEALENANAEGIAAILPNSNNRALIIENDNHIYLQSYDTLILDVDKIAGTIKKLWAGYSVTTLKHINEFTRRYGMQFCKRSWLDFDSANIERKEG